MIDFLKDDPEMTNLEKREECRQTWEGEFFFDRETIKENEVHYPKEMIEAAFPLNK